MRKSPERLKEVRRWLEKGEHDFKNAGHTLMLIEDCPFDTVCFHAQQSAEKYIKSLLVFESIEFPKTHDLTLLLNFVPKRISLEIDPANSIPLNRYSVEAHYPGDWEDITRVEAEDALMRANKLRQKSGRFSPPAFCNKRIL